MVISKIKYGLGNQMLQYALGKRMARDRGVNFCIENFWYEDNSIDPKIKVRSFQLHHFNTDLNPVPRRIQYRYVIPASNWYKRLIKKALTASRLHPFPGFLNEREEEKFMCSKRVLKAKGEVLFLQGVWANLDYFMPILENLRRKDFTFKEPMDIPNEIIARKIRNSNSVAVHIRKGDYLVGKFANYLGTICSPSYYEKAFEIILEKYPDAHFFIFSDDFLWVNNNIVLPDAHTIVDINDAYSAYKDMQLISMCNHAIIANSTFSYWGALLGEGSVGRLVIGPQKWHSNDQGDVNLYLNSWVKI